MLRRKTTIGASIRTDTTVIEAGSKSTFAIFKEVWAYRDLFFFLTLRDIKVIYKQTVLGFLWAFIQPFFSVVVFTFVFGNMAKVPSDGHPYAMFAVVAVVPWTFFQTSMTASSQSLLSNLNMISKVYFPRIILPFVPVTAKLVDFGISLLLIFAGILYYGITPGLSVLYLPLMILLMYFTASAFGVWITAFAIQYRDVKFMIGFLVQLLMYAAPVVWPSSFVKDTYPLLWPWYGLYPMAGTIDGIRSIILGTEINWDLIGLSALSTALLLASGIRYFMRREKYFADVA